MHHLLSLFKRSNRGTSAIEFALIVPVLLSFMAGVVELGRAFQVYNTVNRLATRYAIAWADCPGTISECGAEASSYMTPAAIQNMAPQLIYTSTNPTVRMLSVNISSGGSPTIVWPPLATFQNGEQAAATSVIGAGHVGVVVTISYIHTFTFFTTFAKLLFNQPSLTVAYTVVQRTS